MNVEAAKKSGVIVLVSLALSLLIIRWHSIDNVPFCHYSAGCTPAATPRGKITVTTYGYPLSYRQVQGFSPSNSSESSPNYTGYAYTRVENLGFSLPSLVMDAVFWFALLSLLSRYVPWRYGPKKPTAPKPPDVADNTPQLSGISHRL
jgi:hypothetical protein